MLSRGLIVSMQDLLDRGGWDVRVSAGDLPASSLRVPNALQTAEAISTLPSVQAALVIRAASARDRSCCRPAASGVVSGCRDAFDGPGRLTPRAPWTILRGRDADAAGEVVIDGQIAAESKLEPAARSRCARRASTISKRCRRRALKVVGVAEFPFQTTNESTTGGTLDALKAACGGNVGQRRGSRSSSHRRVMPTLRPRPFALSIPRCRAATNNEVVARFQQTGFTYFRQISSVLTTVTVSFAVLLITVLLTVSVNQRLGEIAALRALGFSRIARRQGCPLGIGAHRGHRRPAVAAARAAAGLRARPHPQGNAWNSCRAAFLRLRSRSARRSTSALLVATAIVAALYPMRIVSRLPIAATLRDEVIG